MVSSLVRYCPVCKFENQLNATTCAYCQASLESIYSSQISTKQLTDENNILSPDELETLKKSLIPSKGLTIYIINNGELIIVGEDHKEIILGRKTIETDNSIVNIGATDVFISRRHAKITKAFKGYVIMDLGSSNGTWLGKERMIPQKIYSLENGALIRLGHIQALIHHS